MIIISDMPYTNMIKYIEKVIFNFHTNYINILTIISFDIKISIRFSWRLKYSNPSKKKYNKVYKWIWVEFTRLRPGIDMQYIDQSCKVLTIPFFLLLSATGQWAGWGQMVCSWYMFLINSFQYWVFLII